MHMVAFVRTALPAYFVAPKQKHLNSIQLSCHIGASGNMSKKGQTDAFDLRMQFTNHKYFLSVLAQFYR